MYNYPRNFSFFFFIFSRRVDRPVVAAFYPGQLVQIMQQLHAHQGVYPFYSFRWFINEKKVIGDYTTEMIIHNATRDLHDAIVKCEVHNDVGKSEDTETLDITCEYANEARTIVSLKPYHRCVCVCVWGSYREEQIIEPGKVIF